MMVGRWREPKAAIANFIIHLKPGTVTIAGHPSAEIPPGTLNSILKQAGLK